MPKQIIAVMLMIVFVAGTLPSAFAEEEYEEETILYHDGTMIFNVSEEDYELNRINHDDIRNTYPPYEENGYRFFSIADVPWDNERDLIKKVEIGREISPEYASYWFAGLKNLEEINLDKLLCDRLKDVSYCFAGSGSEKYINQNDVTIDIPEDCICEDVFKNSRIKISLRKNGNIIKNENGDNEEKYNIPVTEPDKVSEKFPEITTPEKDTDVKRKENRNNLKNKKVLLKKEEGKKIKEEVKKQETLVHEDEVKTADEHNNEFKIREVLGNKLLKIEKPQLFAAGESGKVISARHAIIPGGSASYGSTWVCRIDDGESPALYGCCCEPENQVLPGKGQKVTLKKLSNSSMLAKVAYLGKDQYESDTDKYVVSRAAARANGKVSKGHYDYAERVDKLYDKAKKLNKAPDNFYAYYGNPVNGSQDQLTWRYIPEGYLQIKKESADTDDKEVNSLPKKYPERCNVSGAAFDIYSTDENHNKNIKKVGTLVSGKDGYTEKLKLKPGYYRWHEVKGAVGHSFDSGDYYWCRIDDGETDIRVVKNPIRRIRIKVRKEKPDSDYWKDWEKRFPDEKYNRSMKGAKFNVFGNKEDAETNRNAVASITTDSEGRGDVLLPLKNEEGTYYIREIKASPGYAVNDTIYSHRFTGGTVNTFHVTEPYSHVYIKVIKEKGEDSGNVTKVYKDFYSLAGAEFTVFKDKDCKKPLKTDGGKNVIMTTKKTDDGTFETSRYNLPGNSDGSEITYYVKETKAPKGYRSDKKVHSFTGKTGYDFHIKNTPQKTKVEVLKTDAETGEPVENAEFTLYKTEEDAEKMHNSIRVYKTDNNGTFNKLIPSGHTFYLRETKAPAGYIRDNTIYKLKGKDRDTIELKLSNKKKTVEKSERLKLRKFVKSEESIVKDCPKTYNLEGAVYTIYTETECKNVVGSVTTGPQKRDKDGRLYAETDEIELEEGSYYITETKAPPGYVLNTEIYPVSVEKGKNITVHVEDIPDFDPLSLKLKKFIPEGADWTDSYLEGAEYTVRYYPDYYESDEKGSAESKILRDKPLKTWVFRTDENGEIRIKDQWKVGGDELFKKDNGVIVGAYGTYTFEETKAPPGFIKNEGITIREIRQREISLDISDINYGKEKTVAEELPDNELKRKIVIHKKIPEKEVYSPYGVPTAIFECKGTDVFGKERTCTKAVTLDSSTLQNGYYTGTVTFENLDAGIYNVTEIKTSRYKIDKIRALSNNGIQGKNNIEFNLVNETFGEGEFYNKISRWNDFSDMECIVNFFRKGGENVE